MMTDTGDRSDELTVKKNLEYKQHYRLAEYVKPIVSIQGFKGRPQPYMKFPPYANELKRRHYHQQQQQMLHVHKSSTQDRCMLNHNTQRKRLNVVRSSNYYSNSQHHSRSSNSSNEFRSDNKIGRDSVVYQCDYIIKDDDLLNGGDGDSSHVHDDNDDNRRSHGGASCDKRRRVSKKDCEMKNKSNNKIIDGYDPDNTNHHDHDMDDDNGRDSKRDGSYDHFNDCTYILSMMVEVDISGLLKLISHDKKYFCSLHNLGNKNSKNSGNNDNTFIVDGDDDDKSDDDDGGDDGGDDSIHRSRAEIIHKKWVDGRIIQITKLSVRQKGEDFLLRIRFRNGAEWDIKSSLNLVRVYRHGRGNDRSSSSGDSSSGNTRVGCGSGNSGGNRGSGAIDTEHEDHDYRHDNDIEINYDTNNIHVRVDDYHGDNGIDHYDSGLDDNHKSTLPIFSNTTTSKYRNIVDLLLNDKIVGGGDDDNDEHDDFEHVDDDDDDEFNFDDDSDVDISNAFDYGNNNQFLLSNMISCGVNSTTDGDTGGITNTCNNINNNDDNDDDDDDHHENQDDNKNNNNNDDDDDDDAIFNISTKKVIDKLTNTDRRHHHHHQQHQSLLATGEYVSTNILEEIDSYFKRILRLNVITLPKPRMNVDEYCKLLKYVIAVI
jgi:hypothetical protein